MDPILSTVVAALIAAIVAMWRIGITKFNKCETDRDSLRTDLEAVKEEIAIFKACPTLDCGARAAFRRVNAFGQPTQKIE